MVAVSLLSLDVLFSSWFGTLLSSPLADTFQAQTLSLLSQLEPLAVLPNPSTNAPGNVGEVILPLHVYKARMLLGVGQHRASKREIKTALDIFHKHFSTNPSSSSNNNTDDDDDDVDAVALGEGDFDHLNMTALYLKANLEYSRRNFRKALKLLTSCSQISPPSSTPSPSSSASLCSYLNNMGCIYLRMHRSHAALIYFHKALSHSSSSSSSSHTRLTQPSRGEVAYNTALTLLVVGEQEEEAFRCLEMARERFQHLPQFWIRMAECCVGRFEREKKRQKKSLQAVHVGSSESRRIYLANVNPVIGKERVRVNGRDVGDGEGEDEVVAAMGLDRGLEYLEMAQSIIISFQENARIASNSFSNNSLNSNSHGGNGEEGEREEGVVCRDIFSSESLSQLNLPVIHSSTLLKLAHIALLLNDFSRALSSTSSLLSLYPSSPLCPTAEVYQIEALCGVGRVQEAADKLGLDNEEKKDTPPNTLSKDEDDDGEDSSLRLCRATVKMVVGDMGGAEEDLRSILLADQNHQQSQDTTRDALRSLLYLRWRTGRAKDAIHIAKNHAL